MTRLKTSLLTLLMLCILGYGSAWAFEINAVEMDGSNSVLAINDNQSGDQHQADSKACDHSCHAFAHMLAIFTQSSRSFNSNNTSESLEFSQNFISLIVSPDLRPPRA